MFFDSLFLFSDMTGGYIYTLSVFCFSSVGVGDCMERDSIVEEKVTFLRKVFGYSIQKLSNC